MGAITPPAGQGAWHEEVSLPELMREARDVYRDAVREALEAAGCDDIPRNGVFVLAGLGHGSEPAFSSQANVVASLGLSKQMASQLIDTLVLRNYLERHNDPVDRRRMEVRLTGRGRTAANAIRQATDGIEAALSKLVSAGEMRGLRAGLAAYRTIREQRRGRTPFPPTGATPNGDQPFGSR